MRRQRAVWQALHASTYVPSDAGAAQVSRVAEYRGADGIAQIEMLQWEFEASLQAIVCCGIAVQAFGAVIQSKIQLPQSITDEWQRQGTPQHIQISEVWTQKMQAVCASAWAKS